MADRIRCAQDFEIGSLKTCGRAPDGGSHEAAPHPFTQTRLDGKCGWVDPAHPGVSCGFGPEDDLDGAPAHHAPVDGWR